MHCHVFYPQQAIFSLQHIPLLVDDGLTNMLQNRQYTKKLNRHTHKDILSNYTEAEIMGVCLKIRRTFSSKAKKQLYYKTVLTTLIYSIFRYFLFLSNEGHLLQQLSGYSPFQAAWL